MKLYEAGPSFIPLPVPLKRDLIAHRSRESFFLTFKNGILNATIDKMQHLQLILKNKLISIKFVGLPRRISKICECSILNDGELCDAFHTFLGFNDTKEIVCDVRLKGTYFGYSKFMATLHHGRKEGLS